MKIICFTNIDNYRFEKWPDELPIAPVIGDYIEAESGRVLQVVARTHTKHYLKIELHLPVGMKLSDIGR